MGLKWLIFLNRTRDFIGNICGSMSINEHKETCVQKRLHYIFKY